MSQPHLSAVPDEEESEAIRLQEQAIRLLGLDKGEVKLQVWFSNGTHRRQYWTQGPMGTKEVARVERERQEQDSQ